MSTRRRKRHAKRVPAHKLTPRFRKPATWLHLPFGALIEWRCPAWIEVQLEVLLQRQPQRLDQVYLLRAKTTRDPSDRGRVMRGLWLHIRAVGLAEFKSVAKPFARGDLYRLVGCGWTWLHQNSALTPDDLVLVLIVADVSVELRDELAQCGATFTSQADGYHRFVVAGLALVVVELDAVAEAEKDDYLRAFSHHAVETAEVVQWLYPYLNAPEGAMIDPKQLVGKEGPAPLLRELARACPAASADAAMRLRLKALAADGKQGPVADAAAQRATVVALLGDASQVRRHVDVLAGNAKEIVGALAAADAPERAPLVAAYDAALAKLQADATLSRADRLVALVARVQLACKDRLPALQADARALAARFDRDITDGYERQAVITTAAWMLEEAGLPGEADDLLKANLAKSHSPYYLMSDLADNAKKRGDTAAAIDWAAQAFEKSEGAATRLQWGTGYLRMLVELAPKDAARIESVAARIIDEAAAQPDAFEARSGRSMQRIGKLLRDWDPMGEQAAARARLQQRLDAVCAKLPAGSEARGVCDGALKPAATT